MNQIIGQHLVAAAVQRRRQLRPYVGGDFLPGAFPSGLAEHARAIPVGDVH